MPLKSETAYFMMLQEGEEARVYLKDDVDAALAEKDAEIDRLKKMTGNLDNTFGEAVAELKDKYCTHCVICDKPWGAGEMHMLHRIAFHGRFITNLYTCCDCARKIREGEI